jgi:hypothetical protein
MDNTPTPNTESILFGPIEKLSSDNIYMFFALVVIILTTIMLSLTFTNTTKIINDKSVPSPTGIRVLESIGIILVAMTLVVIVLLLYIPSLKSVLQLLDKLRGVIFIFIFLVGVIIFYRNVSETAITNYRFIIAPIIALISIKLFYNAMTPSTEEEYTPNLQIEKMRVSLVYVTFVIFSIIMYSVDFGGFIREYFGPTFTATLVLLIMGMIYLLTLLSYPIMKVGTEEGSGKGMLAGMTWTGIGHGIFMILTILITCIGVFVNMSDFTDDDGVLSFKNTRATQLFGVTVTTLVIWVLFFSVRSYQDVQHTLGTVGRMRTDKVKSAVNIIVLLLGGIGFISTLVYWIISISHNFTKTHDTVGLIMNLLVIFVIMIMMFKYLANTTHFQKSPYFRLAVNSLFYIPCLAYDTIRSIMGVLGIEVPSLQTVSNNVVTGAKGVAGKVSTVEKPAGKDMMMLTTIIAVYLAYFIVIPYSLNKVAKQGGNIIQQEPISLSSVKTLGTYDKLNGISDNTNVSVLGQSGVFNYTYAISFWVFLESSSTSDNYYTVLNFNEFPHIMWNPKKATMIFTTKDNTVETDTKSKDDITKNGNRILLTLESLGMQKWNNIVINYVNGTLDIFVNGNLIQSSNDVVPEISYGSLTTGSPELRGKICNVVYFNYSLEMKNIHYLYNLVKDTNPPIITDAYFGTTERVKYVAKDVNPASKLIIPINIETEIVNRVEQTADQAIDKVAPTFKPETKNNYLSLAWYFNQNGDNHNSASPEDNIIHDVDLPTLKTPNISGQMLPSSPPIGNKTDITRL